MPGVIGLTLENVGHFLTIGAVLPFLTIVLMRSRWSLVSSLVLILMHASLIARFPIGNPPLHAGPGPQYRVLYANLGWPSRASALLPYIASSSPDMLCLVEYDPEAEAILLPMLTDTYPYGIAEVRARPDCFGVALFSKVPGTFALGAPDGLMPVPAIRFRPDSASFDLHLVHPLPPRTPEQMEARDRYMAAVRERVTQSERGSLIIGDLNTTERSDCFQQLLEAGLHDSRLGFGWAPSWRPFLAPLRWLNGLVSLPLDHALTFGSLVVSERRLGDDFGSDHLPLSVTVTSHP